MCSRKRLLKRLILTVSTALVITQAPSVLTVANKAKGARLAKVGKSGSPQIALGLTRKRGAFNKAISMLAEGAAANPDLAPYYRSLRQRLKGKGVIQSSLRELGRSGQEGALDLNAYATIDPRSRDEEMYSRNSAFAHKPEPPAQMHFTIGDMNCETNASIEHWTNHYSATREGRLTMMTGMERSNAYLEMARAEFRKAGVPEDLVWLAFVESVWNPQARSPAAAGGLWQFMPSVATDYGLKVEIGNDERNDPAKQTRAAAIYLHDLFTIFGDWHLSMAAYNSGEPRVMGAIVKNGRADFWELYDKHLLPRETCDYVPRILASIRVAGQAEHYGLIAQAGS